MFKANTIKQLLLLNWIWVSAIVILLLSLRGVSALDNSPNAAGLCFNNAPSSVPPAPSVYITVTEGVTTYTTYTIRLCSSPTESVTVAITLTAIFSDQIEYAPVALSFDSSNWDKPKMMSVLAKDDEKKESTHTMGMYYRTESLDPDYRGANTKRGIVEVRVVDNDAAPKNSPVYLPLVAKMPTHTPTASPTPTATPTATSTPVPPPQWQPFSGAAERDVDVITIHNSQLFLGETSMGSNKGVYRAASCELGVGFSHLSTVMRVLDLYFVNNLGLLGSRGEKAYFSVDGGSTWKQTTSTINPFVYGVVQTNIANKAFAGADDGVYVSSNGGNTWVSFTPSSGQMPKIISSFRYYNDTASEDTIWITTFTSGVSKYIVSGNAFQLLDQGLAGDTKVVWDILRNPQNFNEMYIGTSSGVYKRDMSAVNSVWEFFGLAGKQVRSLELFNNTLYAGTNKQGLYARVLDGTADWSLQTAQFNNNIIRDLYYDQSGFCKNTDVNRNALLAATDNGLWVYR